MCTSIHCLNLRQWPRKKRLKSWSEISLSHCLIKTNTPICCFRKQNNLVLEGLRLRTLLESVLETTSHCLQISHTTCSLTTTTRTLQSPVVYACTNSTPPTVSHLRIGIATRSTSTLLNVVSTTTTSSANSVCLSVSFTKRRSTLSLQNSYKRLPQNFHKKPLFQIQEMQNSIKIAFRNLPCSNLEYSNTLNYQKTQMYSGLSSRLLNTFHRFGHQSLKSLYLLFHSIESPIGISLEENHRNSFQTRSYQFQIGGVSLLFEFDHASTPNSLWSLCIWINRVHWIIWLSGLMWDSRLFNVWVVI